MRISQVGCFVKSAAYVFSFVLLMLQDTDAQQSGGQVFLSLNPYADVNWGKDSAYKANLHTHTTNSDGDLLPHELIDLYHEAGYSILSIHDHNIITYPWENLSAIHPDYENRNPDSLGMLAVMGNELSSGHHRGNWIYSVSGDGANIDLSFQRMTEQGGIGAFFHPGRYQYAPDWYVDYYWRYPVLVAMETFNQGTRYPSDPVLYDEVLTMLMPERPVWGQANDDFHSMKHAFRTVNYMLMPALTMEDFRVAMLKGTSFYGYQLENSPQALCPYIDSIVVDRHLKRITVHGENYEQIVWLSGTVDSGELESMEVDTGSQFHYQNFNKSYVRAVLVNSHGEMCTQPFGFSVSTRDTLYVSAKEEYARLTAFIPAYPNLSRQWYRNGLPVAGAKNSVYDHPHGQEDHTAIFHYQAVDTISGAILEGKPVVLMNQFIRIEHVNEGASDSVVLALTTSYIDAIDEVLYFADGAYLGISDIADTYFYTWSDVAPGIYQVEARVVYNGRQDTLSASLMVEVKEKSVFSSIRFVPEAGYMDTLGTLLYQAEAYDQYGRLLADQPAFSWSLSGDLATVSADGRVSSGKEVGGPFYVYTEATQGELRLVDSVPTWVVAGGYACGDNFNAPVLRSFWKKHLGCEDTGGEVKILDKQLLVEAETGSCNNFFSSPRKFFNGAITAASYADDFDAVVTISTASSFNEASRCGILVGTDIANYGTSGSIRAGVILRPALAQNQYRFYYDDSDDGWFNETTTGYSPTVTYPIWIRMKRRGARLTGYYSHDSIHWEEIIEVDTRPFENAALEIALVAAQADVIFDNFNCYHGMLQAASSGDITHIVPLPAYDNNKSGHRLMVAPNPFTEDLVIDYPSGALQQVIMYDVTGTPVYQRTVRESPCVLNDFSALSPGFYILQVVTDSEEIIMRTVLKQ